MTYKIHYGKLVNVRKHITVNDTCSTFRIITRKTGISWFMDRTSGSVKIHQDQIFADAGRGTPRRLFDSPEEQEAIQIINNL